MPPKSTTGPTASPWANKGRPRNVTFDERKLAVLNAAAKLFCEKGFEGGSFDELALRLNVSKPTVYYYAGSKEECYYSIMYIAQDSIIKGLEAIQNSDGSALEKLIRFFEIYIAAVQTDFGRCLMMLGRNPLTGSRKAEIERRIQLVDRQIIQLLQEGMDDGSIRAQNPKVVFHTAFGAINWAVLWYRVKGPLKLQDFIHAQIGFLLDGLRGPAAGDLEYPEPPEA